MWLFFLPSFALAVPEYYLSSQGANCYDTCFAQGLNCNEHVETGNTSDIFKQLGATCTPDPRPWFAEDQPSWVTLASDPNYGKCLGFVNVPGGVLCSAAHPAVRRVCHCVDAATQSAVAAFGTGCSQCLMPVNETTTFTHYLQPGATGLINHFWITGQQDELAGVMYNYYIDGESSPSISFTPSMASGVGFNDGQAPWGNKWFGKGAKDGGWFFNFQIPFYKSIRVTSWRSLGSIGYYYIIRGVVQQPKVPIRIGNYELPSNARLRMFETKETLFPAFSWVPLLSLEKGSGLLFMHTLAVKSADENFLEGCYHAYTPFNQSFPGTLLSTGTEDYFDSAWYFNAGEFHLPVSGFTHFLSSVGLIEFSAYRFHEQDPLPFSDGFRFVWRNGDLSSGGIKCLTQGGPSATNKPVLRTNASAPNFADAYVSAYVWVYTW